jgi:uncharacterized protein YceH (UPF0502 family)
MTPMTTDTPSPDQAPAPLPALSMNERRVLGVLVEKAKTTPDAYPLSVNALVTGCNQKSNRDPLLNLSEDDVEDALAGVQQKGLAIKITGGRVVRWRHNLYEAWRLGKVELALLGELLLRGPQTEGELRGRASRMEPIDDLDTLRALLRPMAERGLVVYLSPQGRRGTVLTHGFHDPHELEHLRQRHHAGAADADADEPREPPAAAPAARAASDGRLDQLAGAVEELRAAVAALEERLRAADAERADLAGQVRELLARGLSPADRVP